MNKHNKKIVLVGVIIIMIILLVPLSYAAYTSVTSARRVVSTASAADSLFSSNYLSLLPKENMGSNNAGSEYAYKNIPVSYQSSNTTQAVYVSVCNYAQGYLTKWCDKDINYHIEFSLVDLENHGAIVSSNVYTDKSGNTVKGEDILKLNFKVAEGIATSANDAIPGQYNGKSLKYTTTSGSQNMYTIFFDTTYADIVGVKIEVITEDNSPAYSGYGLGGVLCLSGYAAEVSAGWNGEVQEASENSNLGNEKKKSPEAYTGFNYEVSGAGAGIVTVTWDSEKFAISEIFLENMKAYIEDQGTGSISFKVGEADQGDRFFIQFYRVSQPTENESWNEIENIFSCKFAKTE